MMAAKKIGYVLVTDGALCPADGMRAYATVPDARVAAVAIQLDACNDNPWIICALVPVEHGEVQSAIKWTKAEGKD